MHQGGRLLLLDSASMWFRAFHGVPSSVLSPDGRPVNAVRGFLDVLARQVSALAPDRVVACLDADWRPAFRVAAVPSYKAHRVSPAGEEDVPGDLPPQVDIILEVLAALGIATAGVAGYEADDVIATLAVRHPGPVDILTGDRDLFQLIRDDQPIRVIYAVEKYRIVTEAVVREKYGIPGRSYAAFATLRGDPSDGLPGVPGIGAKTAAALVNRFPSLEAIQAAATDEGFPAGARRKIAAAREYLAAAAVVVRTADDLDLPPLADAVPRSPADPQALLELADRHGLSGAVGRVLQACAALPQSPTGE